MSTRARPNVLVVDDDSVTILAVKAVLSSLDVDVVEASSGDEVLCKVFDDDFAVILMDVQMPGMDGFATAGLIRERPKSRHIPIIFCTGTYTDEPTAFQGYAAGAVDYLFKPVVPAVLRSKVAVFVELFKQRKRLQQQADLLAAKTEELVRSNLSLHAEIAARQQAEAEVRLINRELENRVEERTAQLLRAQRLDTIGVLASGIAHDLNNVLTPLTMGLPYHPRSGAARRRRKCELTRSRRCGFGSHRRPTRAARGRGGRCCFLRRLAKARECLFNHVGPWAAKVGRGCVPGGNHESVELGPYERRNWGNRRIFRDFEHRAWFEA
jgi:CheY-like chemotaxis protein